MTWGKGTSPAPGGWHVPRGTRLRIQELAAQHQTLVTQELAAKTNGEEIEPEREAIQVRLAELPPPVDPSALEQVVQQARRPGDLDLQIDEAQRRLRQSQEQAEIDLRRLGLWSGALSDIESLAVPSPETVTRYEEEFAEALAEIERSENVLNDLTQELQECQQRIEQLVLQQDVPTEADLVAARERRTHGWKLVKGAWLGDEQTAQSAALIQEFSGEGDLASAYEASVSWADSVSDRLRREATQVADKAQLLVLQTKLTRRIKQTELVLKAARNKLDQVTLDWRTQWTPVAIEALSPREMQAWLRRHGALVASAARLREQKNEVEELERKRDEHCQALQQALGMLTPNTTATLVQGQLSAVVQLCEEALGRFKQQASDRSALERDAERLERDSAKAQQAATAARDALGVWRKQWTAVIKDIGLPAGSTPGEARGVLECIEELQGKHREMETLQDRMAGIDREAQHFTEAVEAVAAELELEPHGDVAKIVQKLVDKLRQARDANASRGTA